jgi:hypothetical protein
MQPWHWAEGHTDESNCHVWRPPMRPRMQAQQMSGQSARTLDVDVFHMACPWPHRSPSGRLGFTEQPLRHAQKVEWPGDNTSPQDTSTMVRDAAVLLQDTAWLKDT